MVQSPSWGANWFAAIQQIPRISRNSKVHYRTHKRPPPVSILGQPNPVHIPTSHLLEIHPNIIHPSTPRSPQWSPSIRLPQQDPIHPPLLTHTHQILWLLIIVFLAFPKLIERNGYPCVSAIDVWVNQVKSPCILNFSSRQTLVESFTIRLPYHRHDLT